MSVAPDHPLSSGVWWEATARGLTGYVRVLWVRWALTGSLYGAREAEVEREALRAKVGRECGGWTDGSVNTPVTVEAWASRDPYPSSDGSAAMTLGEVASALGVGRERVRQIEQQALRKLRHASRSRCLKPYVGGDWDARPAKACEVAATPLLHCDACRKDLDPETMISRPTAGGHRTYFCNRACAPTGRVSHERL